MVATKPYQIQITSESVLNDLPEGTVTGNLEAIVAGIQAGQWVTVRTINLNTSSGSTRRRMQVLMDSYGRIAGRLYTNNAWTQWSYGRNSAVKIFERTTSGNETINNISPYGSFQLVAFNNSTSGTYSTAVPRELITNGMKIAVVESGGGMIASIQRSGSTTTYACTVTSGYTMMLYGY